jgi:hypothetical protein
MPARRRCSLDRNICFDDGVSRKATPTIDCIGATTGSSNQPSIIYEALSEYAYIALRWRAMPSLSSPALAAGLVRAYPLGRPSQTLISIK